MLTTIILISLAVVALAAIMARATIELRTRATRQR
jgi:hypothetical protein